MDPATLPEDRQDLKQAKFTLDVYARNQAVYQWLCRLVNTGFAHGSDLVETYSGCDNVRSAEKVLEALLTRGWIARSDYTTPSRDQNFFGVGGMAADSRWNKSAVLYGYSPSANVKKRMRLLRWLKRQGVDASRL